MNCASLNLLGASFLFILSIEHKFMYQKNAQTIFAPKHNALHNPFTTFDTIGSRIFIDQQRNCHVCAVSEHVDGDDVGKAYLAFLGCPSGATVREWMLTSVALRGPRLKKDFDASGTYLCKDNSHPLGTSLCMTDDNSTIREQSSQILHLPAQQQTTLPRVFQNRRRTLIPKVPSICPVTALNFSSNLHLQSYLTVRNDRVFHH